MTEPESAPRESSPRVRWFLVATAVVVVALVAAGGWFVASERRALDAPLAVPADGLVFTVPAGASLSSIARTLARDGVLSHPRALEAYARWYRRADLIKAGEYRIEPGTSAIGLLEQLVAGRVVQHSLTIVEGWTFEQLMAAVEADDRLEHTLAGLAPDAVMDRLGLAGMHPEGRFFPDTYHFTRGTSDVEFLRRANTAMRAYLARAWPQRAEGLPLKSPEEALILASIIEKETGVASERPRIAGVFIERLRKGMRLATDPTVIYGMGDAFDGNLRRRDLRTDTPYNTYLHRGLPPTPIAIPSAAAIDAALHPLVDGALYFVAKGDGSHHFSTTYEEHQQAVNRYQKHRGSSGG